MNANYWNTVNEGGEGYVKRAPAIRSRDEVEFDLRDAERDLTSAKINASYKNNEDGSDYKVERLEVKILKLRAELGLPATPAAAAALPVALVAPTALAAPAATPQQKAAAQTQARMIVGKRRTHADAVRFAKAALSGGDKVRFLAVVKAAFPELYQEDAIMYLLKNGDEVTKEQIAAAFASSTAVLAHQNAEGRTDTSLMLDGREYDTRGECYSVWDECWTTKPKSLAQCYAVARC